MARQTKFAPVKTAEGWRLNVPAKFTLTGKRERYFYPTQKQALEAAKRLKQSAAEFGHQSQAIKPSLAEDASAEVRASSVTSNVHEVGHVDLIAHATS